jgi:ABC-type transporter Mla subunit MlaD
MRRGLALVVAVTLLVTTGGLVWWFAYLPGARARERADSVAAGLASGTLQDACSPPPVPPRS